MGHNPLRDCCLSIYRYNDVRNVAVNKEIKKAVLNMLGPQADVTVVKSKYKLNVFIVLLLLND